jgi:nanoRNase/pAp phosphatase (c-di-AMP/oligoRNAs hydrolase)
MSDKNKYRLVTRSDFDGLVCAVLLKELDMIDDIKFVHPKDMQDNLIEITDKDIITNLPYVNGCHLAFDHHASESERNVNITDPNYILDPLAPSAARVVYEHFGGKDTFKNIPDSMMISVDKADSAQFTIEDVLIPKSWELLSFIMDSRTGLGRFKEFTISNYKLMMQLIDACRTYTIDEILELPDVKERVSLYLEHQEKFEEQIMKCASIYNHLAVLDLREEEVIFAGNRFYVYGMFPQCNVSIHRFYNKEKTKNVFAVGKSIFNKTCNIDIGHVMLKYGGGGHKAAGTCQIDNDLAEQVISELIEILSFKEM